MNIQQAPPPCLLSRKAMALRRAGTRSRSTSYCARSSQVRVWVQVLQQWMRSICVLTLTLTLFKPFLSLSFPLSSSSAPLSSSPELESESLEGPCWAGPLTRQARASVLRAVPGKGGVYKVGVESVMILLTESKTPTDREVSKQLRVYAHILTLELQIGRAHV